MLLDHQRHVVDVDLLDHRGMIVGMGCKSCRTGAKIKAMVERIALINSGEGRVRAW